MIILDSARKHGISDFEMLSLVANPYVVYELESDSEKLLYLGFDSKARAIEVITDSGKSGQEFIIHADFITKNYERILQEAII